MNDLEIERGISEADAKNEVIFNIFRDELRAVVKSLMKSHPVKANFWEDEISSHGIMVSAAINVLLEPEMMGDFSHEDWLDFVGEVVENEIEDIRESIKNQPPNYSSQPTATAAAELKALGAKGCDTLRRSVCYRRHQAEGGDMNRTIIIGVGGAGCTIAEQLGRSLGYKVLVVNTVGNHLEEKAAQHRLYLNIYSRSGRLPTVITAEAAAGEAADEFRKILDGNQRVILVAGLGGITGSGAAPALARIARAFGAHITAVATLPFSFEEQRRTVAEAALLKLKAHADALILHDHSAACRSDGALQESLNDYFDRVAGDLSAQLAPSRTGGAA